MSIIEATSGTYRSRVDGTIVLSVEISPIHAKAALELFGMPGTLLAIAALKDGSGAVKNTPAQQPEEELKGGPMAQAAGMICNTELFQQFADGTGAAADELVRTYCNIKSRRELDHNVEAARRYGQLMTRFRDWQQGQV